MTEARCLDDNVVLAYVEHRLAGDTQREVEQHLDSCRPCLALTCAVAASQTDLDHALDGPPDRVAGRYQLVEMIGQGATGSVYAAFDPQLSRRIAVKLVRSARFAEPAVRARLSQEARAMARVTHANVVSVYDAGELDDGIFIAMELVDGVPLADWQTGRSWREIVAAYAQAGRGLGAAHDSGIVHRDFKPTNAMVDRHGRVCVTDFGLAFATADELASSSEQSVSRTMDGTVLGTPRYMSPEQLAGHTVTAQSDQFSFAVALYEALCGAVPFPGSTLDEIRLAMARPLEIPNRAKVVATLLRRALAMDKADRFASMPALVSALERSLGRRRVLYLVPVVIGIVTIGAALAITFRPNTAASPQVAPAASPGRTSILVAPFENTTGDPELDDTLDVLVGDTLAQSTSFDVYAGPDFEGAAMSLGIDPHDPEAVATAARRAKQRTVILVRGTITLGGDRYVAVLSAGEPEMRARQDIRKTTDRRAMLPADVAALAESLRHAIGDTTSVAAHVPVSSSLGALHAWSQGQHQVIVGDNAASEASLRTAILKDPGFAPAYQSLGNVLYNAGRRPEAAAAMELAIRYGDRLGERQRLALLGDAYGAIGRYAEAIAAYEQLLSRWPGDARTEINAAATAIDAQSWELALELARRAKTSQPAFGIVWGNLLIAEVATGRYRDAIADGVKMLDAIKEPTSFALCALAAAYALAGDLDAAAETISRLPADGVQRVTAAADLAVFRGDLDGASRMLRAFLAVPSQEDVRSAWLLLGRVLALRNEPAAAAEAAAYAVDEGSIRPEYVAARVRLKERSHARELVASWKRDDRAEWRLYGHMLDGDLALLDDDPRAALVAYKEAEHHGASWFVHERRAHAYAALGQWREADTELRWCESHRGELAVFMTPSLSFIRELDQLRQRIQSELK